jgi:hypothetical protein
LAEDLAMPALCRAVVRALLVVLASAVVPAVAAATAVEVSTCGRSVVGKAVLTADLDCSATSFVGIEIEGTLDLNGHTIIGPPLTFAVHCLGSCTIRGPGAITGSGAGLLGRRVTKIKQVLFTGLTKAIDATSTGGKGRLILKDTSLFDNGEGIVAKVPVKLDNSIIMGTAFSGVEVGLPSSEGCESLRLNVKRTTVLSSGSDPSCGVDRVCADLVTCGKKPRVTKSSCDTTCQGFTLPCVGWGVCSADPEP